MNIPWDVQTSCGVDLSFLSQQWGIWFVPHFLVVQERCFTQMHSRRESAYRRFERPFAEWCVENSWIVHMNYPRFVIPLSMAEQMHLLFDQQEHAIKELITAEASKVCRIAPSLFLP